MYSNLKGDLNHFESELIQLEFWSFESFQRSLLKIPKSSGQAQQSFSRTSWWSVRIVTTTTMATWCWASVFGKPNIQGQVFGQRGESDDFRFLRIFHSYGHLLVITGYKWDYTIYKWGYKYL